jgi:hypothetical protein
MRRCRSDFQIDVTFGEQRTHMTDEMGACDGLGIEYQHQVR